MNKREPEKGRKAWLVMWQSPNLADLEKRSLPGFVCVLPPNLGRGSVQMILKTLWAMSQRRLEDRVSWGVCSQFPKQLIEDGGWMEPIIVGCGPYLTARRVENLRVIVNESGSEDLQCEVHFGRNDNGKIIPPCLRVLRHGQKTWELEENA